MKTEQSLEERIDRFQAKVSAYTTKVRTLSLFRVITFLTLIADLVAMYNTAFSLVYVIALPVLLIIFIWLISLHKKNDYQLQLYKELVAVNREEIARLHLELNGLFDGSEFEDDHHPYTQDLDIFGEHSLFQLMNRSPLRAAKELLASWMRSKDQVSIIKDRQEAVRELVDRQDWTQHFLAIARVIAKKQKPDKEEIELKSLFRWANEPEQFKNLTALRIFGVLLSLTNLSLLGLTLLSDFPYQYFIISFFVNALFLGISFRRCKELGEQLNQSHLIIRTYLRLIETIENESYESRLLQEIKSQLNDGQASAAIRSLDKIAYRFSSRSSMFYGLMAPVLMADYHLLAQAIKWKNTERSNISKWFHAVDEFNALISIAGYRSLLPDHVFPVFSEKPFTFKGTAIGHPLIPAEKRVTNDFVSDRKGEVIIITGSNMSGKSTFERTLGINVVLAQLGAPVCATSFEIYPMDIFTSMRTKDNLEESTSSFYAELKRLRKLLDHVAHNPVTFYVIDEVLKGTNSEDRHKGAVSLAKQLSQKNCFGLISTHDLSLSELADENDLMVNYSFNSTIADDKIIFDYKLTPGPCRSFNASKLMENMGIILKDDPELG
ncbi:MAG: hypothetical protein WBA74_16625 [Cyclobacteriaceae bacterium]